MNIMELITYTSWDHIRKKKLYNGATVTKTPLPLVSRSPQSRLAMQFVEWLSVKRQIYGTDKKSPYILELLNFAEDRKSLNKSIVVGLKLF